jgi:3-hydroxyisobutyrate dehydrogenase
MSAAAAKQTIGFVGLGAMGSEMVRQLAGAGFPLVVHDADRDRASAIASALKAIDAPTPAELAARAEIIVTMLPTSDVVAEVLTDALPSLRPDTLVIEMSSGVPSQTRELAKTMVARGGSLVDAPVSGGVPRARTGELAIMFGGGDAAFARAEPVLKTMGRAILRTGDVGSAHAMKALNNLVSAGGFLIGIEALLIGNRYGLDPAVMVDVLNASTGMNNSTQKKFKQFVLSRKFDAGFGLDLMAKDLGIAMGVAEETGTVAPFAALCRALWAGAQRHLGPGQDHTAMARFSEMLTGSRLGVDE